jgi:tRNA threonylcarbamoyladenosine biosynthesis protein TsaB
MELCIDTATRYASVAISSKGNVVMELAWRSERNHSVELVPAMRRLMDQAATAMGDLDAIVVVRGPGGFSALRVGISVAKSLALARSIPLVGIGTMEIEARPYLGLGLPVCALIEAGKSKIYAGDFDDAGGAFDGQASAYRVETREALVASIRRRTLFCGEGSRVMAGELREGLGDLAVIVNAPPPTRRPGVLAQLGYERLAASDIDDPDSLQPIYMRGAQVQLAQRRTKKGS